MNSHDASRTFTKYIFGVGFARILIQVMFDWSMNEGSCSHAEHIWVAVCLKTSRGPFGYDIPRNPQLLKFNMA